MADKGARDARLGELEKSVTKWATARRKYLNDQVSFGRRLLKGRTGAERLNDASVSSASELLVDEIEEFLTG
jgi:hypothetical protein